MRVNTPSWTNARYAWGPEVAEWMLTHRVVSDSSRSRSYDLVRKWAGGRAACVFVLDEVLTERGRHLSELPDGVWMRSKYERREI